MVKITYKGESRNVPATYLKGLKGAERKAQIKSFFEGKDRPKTKPKVMDKGKGAYYSSGSRPNQTAHSWAYGRLASVILGGPARKIDKDIWKKYNLLDNK